MPVTDKQADVMPARDEAERSPWVQPEVRRMAAVDAENSGGSGDDGVTFIS
jgi:hypothetical protein